MDFSGVSSYALPWRTSVWVYAIFSRHTFFKGLQQQRDAGDESFRGATFFSVPLLLGKRNHTLMGSFTFKNQGGLFLLYISGKVWTIMNEIFLPAQGVDWGRTRRRRSNRRLLGNNPWSYRSTSSTGAGMKIPKNLKKNPTGIFIGQFHGSILPWHSFLSYGELQLGPLRHAVFPGTGTFSDATRFGQSTTIC